MLKNAKKMLQFIQGMVATLKWRKSAIKGAKNSQKKRGKKGVKLTTFPKRIGKIDFNGHHNGTTYTNMAGQLLPVSLRGGRMPDVAIPCDIIRIKNTPEQIIQGY